MRSIHVRLFQSGQCRHLEFVTLRGGSWAPVTFPALWAVLEHPEQGRILVDTGYAPRLLEACRQWPFSLYPILTPLEIDPAQSAAEQLRRGGVDPEDIRHVIITHFHGDHIAGLRDFPRAQFHCAAEAWEGVRRLHGWAAVRRGFVPAMLPDDFEARLAAFDLSRVAVQANGLRGFDLFGDGSLLLTPLPGHARGQAGVWVTEGRMSEQEHSAPHFLVADAVWHSAAVRELRLPNFLARLVTDNWRAYQETVCRLHQLHAENPNVRILPFHCRETATLVESLDKIPGTS